MIVKTIPLGTNVIVNKTKIQALELSDNTSDRVDWIQDNSE